MRRGVSMLAYNPEFQTPFSAFNILELPIAVPKHKVGQHVAKNPCIRVAGLSSVHSRL